MILADIARGEVGVTSVTQQGGGVVCFGDSLKMEKTVRVSGSVGKRMKP